jgi:hypothetical protein
MLIYSLKLSGRTCTKDYRDYIWGMMNTFCNVYIFMGMDYFCKGVGKKELNYCLPARKKVRRNS